MNCKRMQKAEEEFHRRRRILQEELLKRKKTQQQTVLHIRRLKKVRRKLNAIVDKHGIKLRQNVHRESTKNLTPKEKFLQNLAHRHFVYCLSSVEGNLVAYRGLFQITSEQSRQLKKELAALHRAGVATFLCGAGTCDACLKFDVVE